MSDMLSLSIRNLDLAWGRYEEALRKRFATEAAVTLPNGGGMRLAYRKRLEGWQVGFENEKGLNFVHVSTTQLHTRCMCAPYARNLADAVVEAEHAEIEKITGATQELTMIIRAVEQQAPVVSP